MKTLEERLEENILSIPNAINPAKVDADDIVKETEEFLKDYQKELLDKGHDPWQVNTLLGKLRKPRKSITELLENIEQ